MTPEQPAEEQILLTVTDQSKLDLVMEFMNHFDLVKAERIKARPTGKPIDNSGKAEYA